MKFVINVSTLISLSGFLLAATTTLAGAILWYVNTEKKKYAAERDFQHLKRNQEQISQGLGDIVQELERHFDKVDRRFDQIERDILEIKIRNSTEEE